MESLRLEIESLRPKARTLVISSIFASLLMALRVVPTFPVIGLPGGRFSASDVILPLYGVLLGPLQGTIVVVLGTVLGFVAKPPAFLFLDFLPPAVNTLIVGLLYRKRTWPALLVYMLALLAFLLGPFTLVFVRIGLFGSEFDIPFHWLHLVAIPIALVLTRLDAAGEKAERITWKRFSGCALLGTMGQHSTGSLLFQCVLGFTGSLSREGFVALWHAVFWVYPVERVILVLVGTLVGVPVVRVLTGAFENRQKPS